jgi:hypothetical protein
MPAADLIENRFTVGAADDFNLNRIILRAW